MARTMEKNELLRQQSKEKIRISALRQFARKGLSATRIQDIAMDADISQGLLYRYYASKNDIYADLVEDALEKMNQAVLDVEKSEATAKQKLLKTIEVMYKTIEESERYRQTSSLIAEAMASEAIPPETREILDKKRDLPYQVYSRIISQGQQEGEIIHGDPYELAVIFWSALNGLTVFRNTRKVSAILPDKKYLANLFLAERISKWEEENEY